VYALGEVALGTVSLAVKLPPWSPVTRTAAPVSRRVSVPARPHDPVLPATSTGVPGEVEPGLIDVMTGVLVTVTLTVADGQAARRLASATEPQ
jgi:hypothetical protein